MILPSEGLAIVGDREITQRVGRRNAQVLGSTKGHVRTDRGICNMRKSTNKKATIFVKKKTVFYKIPSFSLPCLQELFVRPGKLLSIFDMQVQASWAVLVS